jgi:hypothetical protein
MSILNTAKLLVSNKLKMAEANAKFKLHLASEKYFFDIPAEIKAIKDIGTTTIDTLTKDILQRNHTQEIKTKYLKTVSMTKELFTTDYPSKYRTKYIRQFIADFKKSLQDDYDKNKSIIDAVTSIDGIIGSLATISTLYLANRKALAKKSRETLTALSSNIICVDSSMPFDVSINAKPFKINLNCPVITDDVLVPHRPFEDRENSLSCEVVSNISVVQDASVSPDLITIAIIQNKRENKLNTSLTIDSFVDIGAPIGSAGNVTIYSPVQGYVQNVSENQIVLRDISDTGNNSLESQVNLLGQKYATLNDIKAFLKAYNVNSLYPVMLANSVDTSTATTLIGTKPVYDAAVNVYKNIEKGYDKNIKNIAGISNVEKHAKNETLTQIEDDITKEDITFYGWIKSANTHAPADGATTLPWPKEFSLSSYYSNLIQDISTKKNPNSIEIDYEKNINNFITIRDKPGYNTKQQTKIEGNYIQGFFNDLWKQYDSLPTEIEDIQNNINNLSTFASYASTTYEEKPARLYVLNDKPDCTPKDENFKPSTYGYGDIEYWLKWCAGATLASVANPITGWATGWIIPSAISFPVVYIPVKPIQTSYGFILLGITICGIFVYPFMLMSNLSSEFHVPFGDPTIVLKNEIAALKKGIAETLANLKNNIIKKMMYEIHTQIIEIQDKIKGTKESIAQNSNNIGLNKVEIDLELHEQLHTEKLQEYKLTQKYQLLSNAQKLDTSLAGISDSLEQTQKSLDAQLDKLTGLANNLNKTLAALPISLAPNTANFNFTIKNPKPIINIAQDLDDNVNKELIASITNKFSLQNVDLLSPQYETILSNSILNTKEYNDALIAINNLLVTKDPFPKYQSLSPINLPWLSFLYEDYVTVGAQSFGFPEQPPLPL